MAVALIRTKGKERKRNHVPTHMDLGHKRHTMSFLFVDLLCKN
jgi:hypothetical protein